LRLFEIQNDHVEVFEVEACEVERLQADVAR